MKSTTTSVKTVDPKKRICKDDEDIHRDKNKIPIVCCKRGTTGYSPDYNRCLKFVALTSTKAPATAQDLFDNCPSGFEVLKITNFDQNWIINNHFENTIAVKDKEQNRGFVIGLHVPLNQTLSIQNLQWADGSSLGSYRPFYYGEKFYNSAKDEKNAHFTASYVYPKKPGKMHNWIAVDFANNISPASGRNYFSWIACGHPATKPVNP
ncbi:hypothetical protein L596_026485 [Steinernema carpocapsae]|uniref:C-type lectin domain-containing protein n=1 Tax=Steinernema carpocapsae TaxID=34508 RepID=A0A4U5M1I6_STECR|nr:hypothetical protein L596_026485 [Steinernema carpocapsae]